MSTENEAGSGASLPAPAAEPVVAAAAEGAASTGGSAGPVPPGAPQPPTTPAAPAASGAGEAGGGAAASGSTSAGDAGSAAGGHGDGGVPPAVPAAPAAVASSAGAEAGAPQSGAPAAASPLDAPPPVGPPSPYGPPPAALAGPAQPQPPSPYQPPAAHPSPYEPPKPPPSPYEPPRDAQPPVQPSGPPSQPSPQPAYDPRTPYAPPQAPPAPQHAGFAAQQPPAGQPGGLGPESGHAQGQHGHAGPGGDPFASPAAPAYAAESGGPGGGSPYDGPYQNPLPQPGAGGPGAPMGPMWGGPVPPSGGKRRGIGGLLVAVLVAALVAGGVGGGIGYEVARHNNDSGSTTVSAPNSSKAFNRAPTSVAGIANKALPSVVTIKASGSQESGTGTGFVYDTQGHILTNNHVVAPAADGGKLTVTFSNGNTYDAEVIGRAQGYDVAVVKLKNASGIKLTPLPLGDSDQAVVGDATIAIGAPFGLSGTVTTGIVSAVHRPVASSDGQGSSPASYMSAIQTDASINPGNSGGPLLNANGAVIGINSAIQPGGNTSPGSQGGSVGLGFAIPINQAKRVADQLIRTGVPVYPVIGVSLNPNYEGAGAQIDTASGAIVAGGPGDKAGLKSGDVITKFDDTIIDSGQTLIGEIWQHQPGDKADITYTRDGSTHTTTVVLGSRKGDSTQ